MSNRKVLMFGWEFPPFNSGGLGIACEGLIRALSGEGERVVFVLPKKMNCRSSFCRIIFASPLEIKDWQNIVSSYVSSEHYQKLVEENISGIYSLSLIEEVKKYAQAAGKIALLEKFDLIHAHDWLSFPAGLAAKKISGKPLVIHVHATEFDRTGGHNVNSEVYEIEKTGLSAADAVIAVSRFTKEKIVQHYNVVPEKIRVVHNAVDAKYSPDDSGFQSLPAIKKAGKIVLFVGRLTLQKGPDYFLKASQKVLEKNPDVFFVITGSGDMESQLINQALELGIIDRVIFTGFLRGRELERVYQMADLYVLPSVSEPFGITVLEALKAGTPVLISKQSGVNEVLANCLRVNFWDVDQMANKILAVLEHQELHQALKENGSKEVQKFSWQQAAQQCIKVYNEVLKTV